MKAVEELINGIEKDISKKRRRQEEETNEKNRGVSTP